MEKDPSKGGEKPAPEDASKGPGSDGGKDPAARDASVCTHCGKAYEGGPPPPGELLFCPSCDAVIPTTPAESAGAEPKGEGKDAPAEAPEEKAESPAEKKKDKKGKKARKEEKKDKKGDRDYFTTFPPQLDEKMGPLMDRGQERFNVYCAPCHGLVGDGNGMVSIRALERQDPEWATPTSVHASGVRGQPVGQLFNTITNGFGKMPDYAAQIPAEDRWAIVLYVRALQRSQNAGVDDVPEEMLPRLR